MKQRSKNILRTATGKLKAFVRRYPLVVFALVIAIGMVSFSYVYSRGNGSTGSLAAGSFDTSRVLPQPVSIPAQSRSFTADSIKQYDGKNGHQCYVAVKGVVYEIKDNSYWQNGQHTPSNDLAYCGADLTNVLGKSPHGDSVLSQLPKVGVFK